MNHRAGFINGEGDGVGIHIDIPRALWSEKLKLAGANGELAQKEEFVIGHVFINKDADWALLKSNCSRSLLLID